MTNEEAGIGDGRGPEILTDIEGHRPYVKGKHVVQFGQRDGQESIQYDSQQIADTDITVLDLSVIKELGIREAARQGITVVTKGDTEGFWIHLDVDVINNDEMPAVDYCLPDGLSFEDISATLRGLIASKKAVGMSLTIFNPKLDPDGTLAIKTF